ncbi:ATP/GTP-binding protein [Sphaerisporangium flaviroseum]
MERVEDWPDGEWKVRMVSGAGTDKLYRCPGCEHEIRPGLPHIVSWPNWTGGEEERRHWHTACWRKRADRGPGRSRY